jgi:hypothetical protein
MWLKKLSIKLRKRAFANTVLIQCSRLLSDLLESDSDNNSRQEVQEIIGNHCFDIIRKKGSQEINDFRKEMIEKVLGIVQSDNPIISMRKELIHIIHSATLNRTFFTEKFADHRKELYEAFNKCLDNAEIVNSDDTTSVIFIWSEAESCILRLLQSKYFEETSKDDWFSNYSKAYQAYIEMFFELILSKKNEKDFSINGVLFPVLKQQIEAFQQKLIGEVI